MRIKDLNNLLEIYNVCCSYHSGQRSRGYKLLCMIKRKIEKSGHKIPHSLPSKKFNEIANKYQNKL